ncbi:DNA-3-methyladenine glycosylase 2 family protein [Sphingomonas sp.]|uniref:DNA-3-methyladenine glycosylase family protein n=1 Tax=Sphingomonas sp. TaxID=28214 RepID=UPI000DB6B05F|nr:DNA-3-methyladenine glycosylase 2 family protein [Sphingomonas sp.]PZU11793.1 MAG: DNA glycosylase [Sphingomonas sp.]
MGLSAADLRRGLDALALVEPAFATGLATHGYPEPRTGMRGHVSLLRTIVGQQVSTASANAIYRRLEALIGAEMDPATLAATPDEALRAVGLSRQKISYVKSLAGLVADGELDLAALPADDEEAIAQLTRIKGIGRWSAEIYLLFAEGRPDVWPAGDLAVQIEIGHLLGHDERPAEKLVRSLSGRWSPYRGALAIFTWHHYGRRLSAKGADKAPI